MELDISQASQLVRVMLASASNPPLLLLSSPGQGKTDAIKAACKALALPFIILRLSELEPVDGRGLPHIVREADQDGNPLPPRTEWARPCFFPTGGEGVLFLDEMTQAVPAMQQLAMQLLRERRVGEHVLPDGWRVIAAGNRASDRAGAQSLLTPLASRVVQVTIRADLAAWLSWARKANISAFVQAFLQFRPDALSEFDPARRGEPFPCPRTWEMVSQILAAGLSPELRLAAIAGTIGDARALEFQAFLKMAENIPPIETILLLPDTASIPADASEKYAYAASIAHKFPALVHAKPENAEPLLVYLRRLGVEYTAMAVQQLLEKDATFGMIPAIKEYVKDNLSLILGK